MAQNIVKVADVKKAFAGVEALKGISLEINAGEIHCLAGENGSGKSTLIKIISGEYTPSAGHIEVAGKVYNKITPIEAIKNGIQVIYQDFSVFPNLTVMENLAFNSELAGKRKLVNKRRMRNVAEEAISRINFKVDLNAKVGSLSVASKQMIAISRALMFDAKLIIMDEPTTALTRKEVNALFKVILNLKAKGIAILFVSHKLDEVFEISERFTILRNGELVASGNTADLDDKKFSYHMTGREIADVRFTRENTSSDPVLEVKDLKLRGYFEDINFSLKRGEILGITGLLGSGRTELALTIFGLRKADGGHIKVDGEEVVLDKPTAAIEKGIGYVPDDRLTEGLFLPRSIGDNAIIAEIDKLASKPGMISSKTKLEESERLVKLLAIATPNPKNACNTLSGGNQQRVVLAKWLATELKVLILNGPTVGVDIGSKRDIHEILHNLAHEGLGIIRISDDLPEIIGNSSNILIMRDGKISNSLKPEETSVAELTEYIMQGVS